jgi:hypothetical protein
MTAQKIRITWFTERSAGEIGDSPMDEGNIVSNDEESQRENKEKIHEEDPYAGLNLDPYVNLNLNNMCNIVIDKETGQIGDSPTDEDNIVSNDEESERENKEKIHEEDPYAGLNLDPYVNLNLNNMCNIVVDKEKITSQMQEEVTWFWERSRGPIDDYEERERESGGEIHEDDTYIDYNLSNLDSIVVERGGEEREWEDNINNSDQDWDYEVDEAAYEGAAAYSPNNDQVHTSRWGREDWKEEDEEQIRSTGGYTIHELRLLTLGTSCTRCGREHDGSCAIGATISSGCSSG